VVSTERGARGLASVDAEHCLLRPIAEFPEAIGDVVGAGAHRAAGRAALARRLVEETYDWQAIARRVKPRLVEAADRPGDDAQRLMR
jgi:hypothetical protein